MFKELIIAGLLGSVSSIDTHHNTHYLNNTVYEELKCSECKNNNLKEPYINYVYDKENGAYAFMDMFLDSYKTEVVDPFDDMLLNNKPTVFAEVLIRDYFFAHLHGLEKKTHIILAEQRTHPHIYVDYIAFRISHDGLLMYGDLD